MIKTKIINILGAPGVGKSTLAADVYTVFKKKGIITELVGEFAKDLIYKQNLNSLKDQVYISGIQHHKIWSILQYFKTNNINNGIIITDSPLILGSLYSNGMNTHFNNFLIEEFNNYYPFNIENYNYLIVHERKDFETIGRKETKKESLIIENKLIKLLKNEKIDCYINTYEKIRFNIINNFIFNKN